MNSNPDAADCGGAAGWPPATWPPVEARATVDGEEADNGLTPIEGPDVWGISAVKGAGAVRPRSAAGCGAVACVGLAPATWPAVVVPSGWARPYHCGLLGSLMAIRAAAGPPTPVLILS
jgi:hypothetical protein